MRVQVNFVGLLMRGVLLLVFVLVFTLFINLSWFDESLHPDLVAVGTPRSVSMENNAYPLIHGFTAAYGKDPLDVGNAIIQELRDRFERGERVTVSDEEMDEMLGGSELDEEWRSGFQSLGCNSRLLVDCAGRLIAEIEHTDLDQPRLHLLIQRYEKILQTFRFAENEEFDAYTPLPRYGLLMQVARLRLAISYQRDTVAEFLAHVEEDIKFWRNMLDDGQSLIAKMVALAGFRNDLEFISALLRLRELSNTEIESIRKLLHPLSSDEQDIGESFLTELRISMLSDGSLTVMLSDYSWVARMFFQNRATLNEYYLSAIMPLRLRASLDAKTFYLRKGYEKLPYDFRAFPPPLYNLGGKLALKQLAAIHSLTDYISRVHDVDGRVVLLLLQAEIEQNSRRRVETIVRSSVYRNPYTGEAMKYDESAHTIGFDCLTENPGDVCSVVIGETRY